jgi:hypothetical protein
VTYATCTEGSQGTVEFLLTWRSRRRPKRSV